MKQIRWILMLVVIALIAAACGGQAPTTTENTGDTSSTGGSPVDAARGYMEAALTGEGDVASFICSSITEEQRTQIVDAVNSMADTYEQMGATVDLSGLTYTVEDETAETATVVLGGAIMVTVSGTTQEVPMTEVSYPVRNENGWKICA
jgi:ABC-type glycerol-3-phosphate transport system substrate-binding protein